jgi:hypothetical protein
LAKGADAQGWGELLEAPTSGKTTLPSTIVIEPQDALIRLLAKGAAPRREACLGHGEGTSCELSVQFIPLMGAFRKTGTRDERGELTCPKEA